LNFMGWAGYDLKDMFVAFAGKTGIKMNFFEQPDNPTMFAQAKLSMQTGAFDVIEPTLDGVQSYAENGLVQAWDTGKISLDNYEPSLVTGRAGQMAEIGGKRMFLPSAWGTEALVFNTEEAPMVYGTASLADLWNPKFEGKVAIRALSALVALGRNPEPIPRLRAIRLIASLPLVPAQAWAPAGAARPAAPGRSRRSGAGSPRAEPRPPAS
jgi:spermidine/putrescine transport system substrate-binding protein